MYRAFLIRRLVIPLCVLALAGCGGAVPLTAEPTGPRTVASSPAATSSPMDSVVAASPISGSPSHSPSPKPTSVTAGPATIVFGSEFCSFGRPTHTIENGTDKFRNWTIGCRSNLSDPRVSGTTTYLWNMDLWSTEAPDEQVGLQWGTVRLESAGGVWKGVGRGVVYPGLRDDITLWYRGSGAYKGLVYTVHISGVGTSVGYWQMEGMIYPGELPPE